MDLFQLFGTISIDNADANKALDNTSQKGQDAESKLKKGFSAVGKGALAVGKTVMTGLAVGGAAMGALTVKAMNLSGELEQNMGGSEQVFGKHAAKMQETAKTAFSNMGLSTSDFLGTANKMGALFQGAGFDIEESADLSTKAMQRAADVASIMGIDTSAAMEAIAGAAKGNFTMMDNLGVAMNDTAIQNYALSKGINKTTAEMTQQEKIGLAMEMFMDKTAYAAGNYAKENQTLAGALGTAKAALTNFLDGSGDVDSLVTSFSNAANVIVNNLKTLAPRLISGMVEIVNQIVPLLPPLIQGLLPVIIQGAVSLINGLVSALPQLVDILVNTGLPLLLNGFTQIINSIISALPQLVGMVASALPTLLPILIDALVSMIVTLCTNFSQIIQPIINNLPNIIISIVNALLRNLPLLIQGAIQLVLGIVSSIDQIIQKLVAVMPQVISMIVTALLQNLPILIKGAIQLVMGIVSSLPKILASLHQALPNAMKGIWNGIKNVFSPLGGWFKDKFGEGSKNAQQAWSTVKKFFADIWKGIKNAFADVGKWFGNQFKQGKENAQKAWSGVKNFFSNIKNGIVNAFSNIKEKLSAPFTKARDAIKKVADKIKGFFKGEISMPKVKLPKFSISPAGWKVGDLLKGKIPKLSIKWNAEGAILKEPTLFGYNPATGQFQGGGEAGDEAVAPISTLQQYVRSAVQSENTAMVSKLDRIINLLVQFFPDMLKALNVQMYLDTGVLVAETAGQYDTALGKIAIKKGRGR